MSLLNYAITGEKKEPLVQEFLKYNMPSNPIQFGIIGLPILDHP